MSTNRRGMSSANYTSGLILNGKPLAQSYAGNIYWVDSGGPGGSRGTFRAPVTTLSAALDLVTSDNGDIIMIKCGHAETFTSSLSSSKSGFSIIGYGFGDNRPTFTNAIGSTADAFAFSGSNIAIQNIKWDTGTDDTASSVVTVMNFSGNHVLVEGCYFEMGAKTVKLMTHDTTAKVGFTFIGNTIVGLAAGPTHGLVFEKKHSYAKIVDNHWCFDASAGNDTGVVVFTSGTGVDNLIDGDKVSGLASGEVYLVQTVVQSMGLCKNVRVVAVSADTALGLSPASGFGFIDCFVTQEGCGVPALADHAGARPAATTPAA